jgi:NAD(P)-dependent dehydrogenase (short-subunit alcohol dehydrogenase family)
MYMCITFKSFFLQVLFLAVLNSSSAIKHQHHSEVHRPPAPANPKSHTKDIATMPTILISGAGSGIGNTFLQHYAKDSANTIHALDVTWSEEVKAHEAPANITTHTVNSASEESLYELAKELNGVPIDLFIHCAAVRGLNPEVQKKDDTPGHAELLDVVDADIFKQTLTVNTLGTFLIIRTVLPNLKAAKNGKVIVMGSGMGSIANNKVCYFLILAFSA